MLSRAGGAVADSCLSWGGGHLRSGRPLPWRRVPAHFPSPGGLFCLPRLSRATGGGGSGVPREHRLVPPLLALRLHHRAVRAEHEGGAGGEDGDAVSWAVPEASLPQAVTAASRSPAAGAPPSLRRLWAVALARWRGRRGPHEARRAQVGARAAEGQGAKQGGRVHRRRAAAERAAHRPGPRGGAAANGLRTSRWWRGGVAMTGDRSGSGSWAGWGARVRSTVTWINGPPCGRGRAAKTGSWAVGGRLVGDVDTPGAVAALRALKTPNPTASIIIKVGPLCQCRCGARIAGTQRQERHRCIRFLLAFACASRTRAVGPCDDVKLWAGTCGWRGGLVFCAAPTLRLPRPPVPAAVVRRPGRRPRGLPGLLSPATRRTHPSAGVYGPMGRLRVGVGGGVGERRAELEVALRLRQAGPLGLQCARNAGL